MFGLLAAAQHRKWHTWGPNVSTHLHLIDLMKPFMPGSHTLTHTHTHTLTHTSVCPCCQLWWLNPAESSWPRCPVMLLPPLTSRARFRRLPQVFCRWRKTDRTGPLTPAQSGWCSRCLSPMSGASRSSATVSWLTARWDFMQISAEISELLMV